MEEISQEKLKAYRDYLEELVELRTAELAIPNRLYNIFLTVPDELMYKEILSFILELTESKYGLLGYINEGGAVVYPAVTSDVWYECKTNAGDIVFPCDEWGGLWGESLKLKKILYSNSPYNVPQSYLTINRTISVPIIYRDELTGHIHLADKETDYDEKDCTLLEKIADYIAPVLHGIIYKEREEKKRREAEMKLEETLKELKRSNNALQQFAYVASHDLQEPLRMVSSYLQLLSKRYKGQLDSEADDFINYAVDGSRRMKNLIDDLLSYSRVWSKGKEFKYTDCNSIIRQVLNNLEVSIEDTQARITCGSMPVVFADETQMIQLFQNLISNSVKFRREENPEIHISCEKRDNIWLFSLKDNGIGVEEKYFDRIFLIFQRLHKKEDYPGTGIGLSICKNIVERHGGTIWVESEAGKGTTFYFTLPDIKKI